MDQMLAAGLPQVTTVGGTALPLAGRARVYACGITPYDVTHLGHAATFVWVDTLARVLHADGTEVIVCRNVTDVDDVLLAAANRDGSPYSRFAVIQQFYFDQDMAALGVRQPALQPRAHAYIGQVIALAAGLLAREAAYQRDGQVYFRGAGAARRAGLDRQVALRLAAEYGDHPDDARKDDPFDVAVWQASDGDQPAWESPWGPGRPGWHAECAAMALHTFGPAIDVHAGGGDLRFPHHAYQAALAEAFTGVTPFARARLQVGVVRVAGAKMAKSAGNLVLVSRPPPGLPSGGRPVADPGPTVGPGLGLRSHRPGRGGSPAGAAAGRGRAPRPRRGGTWCGGGRRPRRTGQRPRRAGRAPHRRRRRRPGRSRPRLPAGAVVSGVAGTQQASRSPAPADHRPGPGRG